VNTVGKKIIGRGRGEKGSSFPQGGRTDETIVLTEHLQGRKGKEEEGDHIIPLKIALI
jgi:hypothetical protein